MFGGEVNRLHVRIDQGGLQMEIERMPGNCDFDIEQVCESVKFQNKHGYHLKRCSIEQDKIILYYQKSVINTEDTPATCTTEDL